MKRIVLSLLILLSLTGCGDSAKSTFFPDVTKADEEVKQTKNAERTANAMEKIANLLEILVNQKTEK